MDADFLAELARQLDAEADPSRLLQRVVDATLVEVPGAAHAGVTLVEGRGFTTPASTSELVARVDHAQYAAREGPCLQAVIDEVPVIRVDDLQAETRWPRFTPAAVALGVRAVLSFQLYARGDTAGALNIYGLQPGRFTEESVHMGGLLAAHAAVGLAATRKELNLIAAVESRDIIGQAKGILMERFKITSAEAFDMLVAASHHKQRKLRDVAQELAETGAIDSVD